MSGNTLIIENLPDDLDRVRSRLELYFKNRRRSGGEIAELKADPVDTRRVFLIYAENAALQKVLSKQKHLIDFKSPFGSIELEVKLAGTIDSNVTAPEPQPQSLPENWKHNPKSEHDTREEQVSSARAERDKEAGPWFLLVNSDSNKDFLQLYFEQFASEPTLKKHGKKTWLLQLASLTEKEMVLAKEVHDHGILVTSFNDRGSKSIVDPRRFVLTGFDDSCPSGIVSMLIGSCSHGAEHVWEILDDERIVVTFKQDIDTNTFMKKCSPKKYQDKDIWAHRLDQTNSVLVEGNMSKISEEMLTLYFDSKRSKGGEINNLDWIDQNKSVLITFREWNVAYRVVEHKHILAGQMLTVHLFFSCLGRALTGNTSPQQNIPTNIIIIADPEILNFIKRSDVHKQELTSVLEKVHASITFNQDTVPPQMELHTTLDPQSLGMLRQGSSWKMNAQKEAQAQLGKYMEAHIPSEAEIWEGIESSCIQFNTENVNIYFKSINSEIVVVGQEAEVKALVDQIKAMVKRERDDLHIKRNTIEKKITLKSKEELGFVWDIVSSKKIDNVKLYKDEGSFSICLNGLQNNVMNAEDIIKEIQSNIISTRLALSDHQFKFLNSLDLKKFQMDNFTKSDIVAILIPGKNCYQIIASKADTQRAKDKIHEVIRAEIIDITEAHASVIRSDQWAEFMAGLSQDLEGSHNDSSVDIIQSEKHIKVCGISSVVTDVLVRIKSYLENKKPVTADVPLKSIQEVEFVESCMKLTEDPELLALGATVLPHKTQTSPCLKVTAPVENISRAKDAVTLRVSTIKSEKYSYVRAGEAKILKKHEMILMAKAKLEKCELYLSKQKPNEDLRCSYDIKGKVTLTIGPGSIAHCYADALVCPLCSMAFDNPVAEQFLKVGGPNIKKVIEKSVKEKQSLLAGDVVLTDAGNLKSKKLVYAMVPLWSKGDPAHNRTYLQAAVRESLLNANSNHCVSIGMPILGSSTFGYPVKESCESLINGILEFLSQSATVLSNIYVVDSDTQRVEQLKSELNNLGYHHRVEHSPSPKASYPQIPVKPDIKSRVIGGVSVILKKGDIAKEDVDVIVNSDTTELNLDSGPPKPVDVVLSGGGNLKCKHEAQIVGFRNISDITTAVGKVLQLSENKMAATLAVPVIGTGRAGIAPMNSVMAIIKGIENYGSQKSFSTLKVIFIVAFEDKIYDAIKSLFNKERSPQRIRAIPMPKHTKTYLPSNQVLIHGVRIEVRKGDITLETVKGIVNSTNADLTLKTGVSGAIFRKAGSAVEQECQNIRPLTGDKAAVTSGGALQCDFIIHMFGPHSVADATARVTGVLECCEEHQITTVSFPAVGTGGGGLTGTDSVRAMLQGISNHLLHRSSTALKLIYLVIDQDKILKEFQQGLNSWKSGQVDGEKDDDDNEEEEEEESSSQSGSPKGHDSRKQTSTTIEVKVGPIRLKVFCGDITHEKTDAIVNSTNTGLNLNSGVSAAILRAAGQTVVDECTALGIQASDGVVITKAGNLSSKHIIHMVGQTKPEQINSSVFKVLQMCETHNIQSVSFPALGTGAGNIGALQVGEAMVAAIEDLVLKIKTPSLKTIHIVIFQAPMMKDFIEVTKKFRQVTKLLPPPRKTPRTFSIKKLFRATSRASAAAAQQPFCLASACSAMSFPAMEAEVWGCSATSLEQVKRIMDSLISEELLSQELASSQFASLLESEERAIVGLGQKNQVQITVAALDKINISGKRDDVLETILQIKDHLQKAKERENRLAEAGRLQTTVRWETGEGDQWSELDPCISLDLERAWHEKTQTINFGHQGETYNVNLTTMQMVDRKGTSVRVKRILKADSDTAVIQPPRRWTSMDGKDLDIVDLDSTSAEYKKVETDFIKSSKVPNLQTQPVITVVKIQRIQSKDQWQTYAVKKQALDNKYPTNKNEMNLYHGTTAEICQKINTSGFNRSFCGRNATHYGKGTYFAKMSWYSCQDIYSNPDSDGLKYLYQARVLVGKPCLGVRDMKEPAPLDPANPRAGLHDSAVNNLQDPSIYVVFCDAGAYPDYLISFKTS